METMLTLASEEYIPRWLHLICDPRRGRSKVNHGPANEPDLTCTSLHVIACFSGCLCIGTVQQTWAFATEDILLADVRGMKSFISVCAQSSNWKIKNHDTSGFWYCQDTVRKSSGFIARILSGIHCQSVLGRLLWKCNRLKITSYPT